MSAPWWQFVPRSRLDRAIEDGRYWRETYHATRADLHAANHERNALAVERDRLIAERHSVAYWRERAEIAEAAYARATAAAQGGGE